MRLIENYSQKYFKFNPKIQKYGCYFLALHIMAKNLLREKNITREFSIAEINQNYEIFKNKGWITENCSIQNPNEIIYSLTEGMFKVDVEKHPITFNSGGYLPYRVLAIKYKDGTRSLANVSDSLIRNEEERPDHFMLLSGNEIIYDSMVLENQDYEWLSLRVYKIL